MLFKMTAHQADLSGSERHRPLRKDAADLRGIDRLLEPLTGIAGLLVSQPAQRDVRPQRPFLHIDAEFAQGFAGRPVYRIEFSRLTIEPKPENAWFANAGKDTKLACLEQRGLLTAERILQRKSDEFRPFGWRLAQEMQRDVRQIGSDKPQRQRGDRRRRLD